MAQDIFGKSLQPVVAKRLYLLDLDGTIYLDNRLIPGAKEFLDWVHSSGRRAIFITNNSSKSVTDYIKKMAKLGINTTSDDYFTSSMAMAIYLNQHHSKKKVYVMGTSSLKRELASNHIEIAHGSDHDVDVVVLGYDTELTYQKLIDVSRLLKKDLVYLATNPDFVCPVAFGFVPDCGAMAELLRHSTGKMPIFIGKPDPLILDLAMEKANIPTDETIVIGDRLYTDIQSGHNANVATLCVLSGEATLQEIQTMKQKPDYVISSIKDLWQATQ